MGGRPDLTWISAAIWFVVGILHVIFGFVDGFHWLRSLAAGAAFVASAVFLLLGRRAVGPE